MELFGNTIIIRSLSELRQMIQYMSIKVMINGPYKLSHR